MITEDLLRLIVRSIRGMTSSQRFTLLLTFVLAVSGIFGAAIVVSVKGDDSKTLFGQIFAVATIMMTLAAVTITMLRYLRIEGMVGSSLDRERLSSRLHRIEKESSTAKSGLEPTGFNIDQIVNNIESTLFAEGKDLLQNRLEDRYKQLALPQAVIGIVQKARHETCERLMIEIEALAKRSNLNLAVGSCISVAGLVLLGVLLFSRDVSPDWRTALLGQLPRIAFIVLVQIFSFFFLRMYRANLDGIRYFQNEITTLETRFTALAVAIASENKTTASSILKSMAATERNATLQKGQSTLLLELAKLYGSDTAGAERLAEIFAGVVRDTKVKPSND